MGRLNKIEWKNIYYMICYCVDELKYFDENLIKQEEINGTHDLLAQLLINSFELLYRNGYIKKYRKETIVTNKPYGNIDIAESIRTGANEQGKLVCHVDTLDTNNKLNQIIKSAFNVLIISNNIIEDKIDNKLITQLYRYRDVLKYVDDIEISYQLLNEKINIPEWYRPIFAVCKMILNDWIALDESGNTRLLELNDRERLCYIWEKFLRAFIKKTYREYTVEKRTLYFSNTDYVTPDILIIDNENNRILVLDAKWYEGERFCNSNLAELGQNCAVLQNELNMGSRYNVTGVNIYASSKECMIRPPRKLDTLNTLYTDSFISVNVDVTELEKQIKWMVTQGFNLIETHDRIYM